MIEVELTLLFVASIIFSFLYEIYQGGAPEQSIPIGAFTSLFWWILGMYYLVAGNSLLWSLALLFNGIGIIYMVRWFTTLVEMRSLVKYGEVEG